MSKTMMMKWLTREAGDDLQGGREAEKEQDNCHYGLTIDVSWLMASVWELRYRTSPRPHRASPSRVPIARPQPLRQSTQVHLESSFMSLPNSGLPQVDVGASGLPRPKSESMAEESETQNLTRPRTDDGAKQVEERRTSDHYDLIFKRAAFPPLSKAKFTQPFEPPSVESFQYPQPHTAPILFVYYAEHFAYERDGKYYDWDNGAEVTLDEESVRVLHRACR
ncbi:hypothetical protein FA95DRAFT_1578381 [Auriscalpium vulgare]|uniref:Uncharacterized protein n=1 Tax=Auriscalpium vulgare TaxID=40419 RepID=A0ACB8R1Z3_9AGAM|nr:hypothetical protein FA95DRAFT_1578381 [Auriscalpium vulgare]